MTGTGHRLGLPSSTVDTRQRTPTRGQCGYLGCPRPAAKAHRQHYGRVWWLGCVDHEAAMSKALTVGSPVGDPILTAVLDQAPEWARCQSCGRTESACRAAKGKGADGDDHRFTYLERAS